MVATTLPTIRTVKLGRLAHLRALQAKQARYATAAAQVKARSYRTPGELAAALDPKTVSTPALELLDANLVDVAEGRCERLIWSMSPQEGKSERVSRRFPLWMLLRNPDMRIAIASYDLSMARRWGRRILNDILEHPELGIKVRKDTSAAQDWQLENHIGGCYSVGIGGPLTGRPVDCVSGETSIITGDGVTTVAELVQLPELPLVLSWNHHAQRAEWRQVEATRTIHGKETVEIHTTAGRIIHCTPDHRIYTTARGYVAATSLRPGDRLVTATDRSAPELCVLRDGVHPRSFPGPVEVTGDTPVLLPRVQSSHRGSDVDVRRVWHHIYPASQRRHKSETKGIHAPVLHESLLHRLGIEDSRRSSRVRYVRCTTTKSGNPILLTGVPNTSAASDGNRSVRSLWRTVHTAALRLCEEVAKRLSRVLRSAVLLGRDVSPDESRVRPLRRQDGSDGRPNLLYQRMQGCCGKESEDESEAPGPKVSDMLRDVPAALQSNTVLFPAVCERRSLETNGWPRELTLSARQELCRSVPQDATADHRAGPWPMCSMPADSGDGSLHVARQIPPAQHGSRTSHQRGPNEQSIIEPDHALRIVSLDASQVYYDTVSLVRPVCGPGVTVYDLQVEGNCNFFAGEILVHNCLVIDDPLKGRAEADSEVYRKAAWDWWTETARTRLAPHAPVVIVATRWHEDDLIGRLITDDEQQHDWRVVNIPAQCESEDDPLGRALEEYMISARLNPDGSQRTVEQWRKIRRDVKERGWSALYQGRPAPAEGAMLKRAWWRYDTTPAYYLRSDGSAHAHGMDQVIQSWDMAFKDAATSSYVVGQVWAKRGAEAFLLDQVRDHMDFPTTCRAVEALTAKWPQATLKLIEDKANGTAVIAQLRKKVPGMVPVSPKDSKEARVSAISPFVEAGNVHLPDPLHTPWVDLFVSECSQFPTGTHDDQVDALTQAVSRLLLLGGSSTDFLNQLTSQAS